MAKNSEFTVQTCTYFCKITVSGGGYIRARGISPGIYTFESTHKESASRFLFLLSDKIWEEDPTGTVKIIKDRKTGSTNSIINKDEDARKEFMWVKLSAQPIKI